MTEIEKLIFDTDKVDLLNVIRLDESNFQRLDLLIIQNYGNRSPNFVSEFLPKLLSFNNISDYYSIEVGQIIKFPEIESLETYTENYDSYENIPGINPLFVEPDKRNKAKSGGNSGIPKLNIELPKVVYNESSGIIKY